MLLTACCQRYLRNKKRGTPRHLRIYMRATSESLHHHPAVRVVLVRMCVCRYSHVYSLSSRMRWPKRAIIISHSHSRTMILTLATLFSFNCSLLAALTSYTFKESTAATNKIISFKNIRLRQRFWSLLRNLRIIFKKANVRSTTYETANVNVRFVG